MTQIKNRAGVVLYESWKADLRGAYLVDANLVGADLRRADLRRADMRGVDLRGADLRGAYLAGAYLAGAYLADADLRGAYLAGADLRGAYLAGADLRGAVGIPIIPEYDPALPLRVAAQIAEHPETHDQTTWHSPCGTKHCVAGWTVILAGEAGKALEERFETSSAATLLLRGLPRLPSFAGDADRDDILAALRAL